MCGAWCALFPCWVFAAELFDFFSFSSDVSSAIQNAHPAFFCRRSQVRPGRFFPVHRCAPRNRAPLPSAVLIFLPGRFERGECFFVRCRQSSARRSRWAMRFSGALSIICRTGDELNFDWRPLVGPITGIREPSSALIVAFVFSVLLSDCCRG